MAQTVALNAKVRVGTGKGPARQARAAAQIPAVIYGRGREAQPLVVDAREVDHLLRDIDPSSTLIDLTVDGKAVKTLIREIQRHPTRFDIMHLDFYEIHAGVRITLDVHVHIVGTPVGVRLGGGVLDQVLREVEIEVLPQDIPERVELNVEALDIGDSLHVSDLVIPNAKILVDAGNTICTVIAPRTEEEPTPDEAAAEAEPELIGKEPTEEEAVSEGEETQG